MRLEVPYPSNILETLETDCFTEKVYSNGLVELTFKDSRTFDVEEMLQAKGFSTSLLKEKKIALLVTFDGGFYPTKEAREMLASAEYSAHQKAIAVVTNDFSIKLLGSLYLRLNKPKTPMKLFGTKAEALHWLGAYLTSH